MLDEEMDDIIRNAAAKHHPAYNDKAWEKMEMQLDKHLPQNKDRRKFIFFLLFFLLLGGGAFFTAIHFAENKTSAGKGIDEAKADKQSIAKTQAENTAPANDNTANPTANDPAANNVTAEISANPENKGAGNITLQQDDNNNNSVTEKQGKNKRSTVSKGKFSAGIIAANASGEYAGDEQKKINNDEQKKIKNNIPAAGNIVITAPVPENKENENIATVPAELKKEKKETDEQKKEAVKPNEEIKEKNIETTKKTSSSPEKERSKRNAASNFGLTVSVGPDLSFITLNKLGKATLSYGAGLSYNFAKRVTVRTGFYFSKKVYTAEPYQYESAPGIIYYDLKEIDASCRVYEIPLSLSYNFWQRKNHNWFGAIGLSSFLMKTEKYNYNYKTASGQPYTYKKEISNQNKHYFSVLTLSGGYQYQLSKRVSIQAEPYVKLPLGGIGLGKIKLNSSGVLLTLTVKPFAKRK